MNGQSDPSLFITADDSHLRYTGRIDHSNPQCPVLIYAGSMVTLRFCGPSIQVTLQNRKNWGRQYAGFVLDGDIHGKILLYPDDQWRTYTLADNLTEGEHELTLVKRMDSTGYIGFAGFRLGPGGHALPLPPLSSRRMECFGDSVSAGGAVDLAGWEGKPDPPNEGQYCNAWNSYIMMTARSLGAQLHNNSQGGLSLLDGTGYFRLPHTLGLESTYDKLGYVPELGVSPWDFSRFTPHVVVVAIGQNDYHPDNDIKADRARLERWIRRYKEVVSDLRRHYPKALFILSTTILNHDACWDEAIDRACSELADPKIVRFYYKRNGCGTPGHPRVLEHMEMAGELTAFIQDFGEEIWMD